MRLQEYRPFIRPTIIGPQRQTLVVPAFTLAVPTWAGASSVILRFPFENTYYFSLRVPRESFGSNFVFAVSWTESGVTYRYKFWDDGVLYYPVYDGERIGLNAVFEVWSVETTGTPTLISDVSFEMSVLLFTDSCNCRCINASGSLTLVPEDVALLGNYENPFGEDGGTEAEPGGGLPTVDGAGYEGYWVFPASGYGKESDNPTYPSNVSAAETEFWIQLLNSEWEQAGVGYSERHLAWYFPNHIVTLYDFVAKYNGGSGTPVAAAGDTMTEFAAPWQLTYLWLP